MSKVDVSCFAPLKAKYDKALNEYVHKMGAREPIRKSGFVNMIYSVWKEGLSENNIKSDKR